MRAHFHNLKSFLDTWSVLEGRAFRQRWHVTSRDFVAGVGALMALVFHSVSLVTDDLVSAPAFVPALTLIHEIILGALVIWVLIRGPLRIKLRHMFYPITVFSVFGYSYILHLCVVSGAPLEDVTLASAAVLAIGVFCILLCPCDTLIVATTASIYIGLIWLAYESHPARTRWFVIDALAIASAAAFHFGRVVLAQRQAAQEYSRLHSLGKKARGENIRRRDAEKQLSAAKLKAKHAAKMASLAEMTGGIAHEINNPLSVIKIRAERLIFLSEKGTLTPEQVRESAAKITDTVERIAKIMHGLRCITRNAEADPFQAESLATIINDVSELCQTRFKAQNTTLRVREINPDLKLECRAVEVAQVMVNLLNNASDAVASQEERWVQLAAEDLGDYIQVEIVDSGHGVPADLRPRLFEPFFTTKLPGKGTGLGLSIAKAIIDAHSGTIRIEPNAPNTTFILQLPKMQHGGAAGSAV